MEARQPIKNYHYVLYWHREKTRGEKMRGCMGLSHLENWTRMEEQGHWSGVLLDPN